MLNFILGIIWGLLSYHFINKLLKWKESKKVIDNISSQFKEVLSNLKKDEVVFVSRINHTVVIDTRISKLDVINIVYLMDKEIICIFKDNNCISTTENIDSGLKNEIVLEINKKFNDQINDVVQLMGLIISKEEFQTRLKEIQDIIKNNPESMNIDLDEESNINEILNNNNIKFDVDQILDKISKHGIKSITPEEKNFLDNLNK
jgi:hypothetical protein